MPQAEAVDRGPWISCHIDTPVRHGSHRRVLAAGARVRRGRFVLRENPAWPGPAPEAVESGECCLPHRPPVSIWQESAGEEAHDEHPRAGHEGAGKGGPVAAYAATPAL